MLCMTPDASGRPWAPEGLPAIQRSQLAGSGGAKESKC